jgi:uncharacterized protein (DUF433 family)
MATKKTNTADRLAAIEDRLRQLEETIASSGFLPNSHNEKPRAAQEAAVEPWQHLVRRQHPWRRQLYIKGRNMTARQLVGSMMANQLNEEETAADFHLPVDAVREAFAYVEQNRELIEKELEIERLMTERGGVARGPQPVS